MTGPEFDEDGPEDFRPAPHPDDRLWRHPSEIAAMHAAQANADTLKVPAVTIAPNTRPRFHTGLLVAAGVVVVGAAALTLGVMSNTSTSPAASQAAVAAGLSAPIGEETTTLAAELNSAGEDALASRVHAQIADSLPRIQAASDAGMREGSGLFVTGQGHIATSAGLVDQADYVLARTSDGRRWKAHVIAVDRVSDVAVLQIDSQEWPAAELSTQQDLWSGQYALALDHQDQTITIGQVVGLDPSHVRIAQAAALPGSAIVDDTGAVIAMVTHDSTDRATPAWMLQRVAVDLIDSGSTVHTWLGIAVEDSAEGQMATVREVTPGSPAADAGLRVGDLIDSIDGTTIHNGASLLRQVHLSEPGESVVLTVTRNSSRRQITAVLAALPHE